MSGRANTDWFRDARWGVFFHWLQGRGACQEPQGTDVEMWNARVDGFDAASLADQLEDIGAGWFFITIGQNTGFYCSPNATYDSFAGRSPSRCSTRDLVVDLAAELVPRGIRMMVYLPSHAPSSDPQAIEGLKCTPNWDPKQWSMKSESYRHSDDVDDRLTQFQRNWEAVIREWSQRWGKNVSGWWFDGCYHCETMYKHSDEPNFKSFAAAAKAGNPDSLVAFNPGVYAPPISITEHEDYTAGEIGGQFPLSVSNDWTQPLGRFVDGAQFHILTFMGGFWGRGEPRCCRETVVGLTKDVNAYGGVITWDVPHTAEGRIPGPFMQRLAALGSALKGT